MQYWRYRWFWGSLPFRVERHIPYQIHGQALAFCKGLPGR